MPPGKLYLVGTPIGNLADMAPRGLETLRTVSLITAEDTRRTYKLLAHFGIRVPLLSYHDHNRLRREPEIMARLLAGHDVALVSDAGMPAISDPGASLVARAAAGGIPIVVIPGPSALTAAVALSGVDTTRFVFEGFPPRTGKMRRRLFGQLAGESRTIVLFEGPHRLLETLRDLGALLGYDRSIAVCRELTKMHEEVFRGTVAEAIAAFELSPPRGECTLVIGKRLAPTPSDRPLR